MLLRLSMFLVKIEKSRIKNEANLSLTLIDLVIGNVFILHPIFFLHPTFLRQMAHCTFFMSKHVPI